MATNTKSTSLPSEPKPKSKKRARGDQQKQHFKGVIHTTRTISAPPFSYIHLSLNTSTSSTPPSLDPLTVRSHLTSALTQFLGLSGSAISVDILKVKESTGECWIRVPREDAGVVVAAVGGWIGDEGEIGWTVKGRGNWLSAVGGDGGEGIWND